MEEIVFKTDGQMATVLYNGKDWSKCNPEELAKICAAGMIMQKGTTMHTVMFARPDQTKLIAKIEKALDKINADIVKFFKK